MNEELYSKITTSICGIRLSTPLMIASGVLAVSPSLAGRVASVREIGAVVTKSITIEPREGYKPPVLVEINNIGFLNAMGLPNPGISSIKDFVQEVKKHKKPVIVSIAGSSPREFQQLASKAFENNADAVEVNLSCPHTKSYGLEIGSDPSEVYKVVKSVTEVSEGKPVIIKIGLADKLLESAEKAIKAGACAIAAINTIKALYIDIWSKQPVLSNIYGGLSGPAIHPIALRVVYDLYKHFGETIDIIGVGGVVDHESAIRFFLAGASAVQIGSAIIWKGFQVFEDIIRGLAKYLEFARLHTLEELIGLAHRLK